MSWATKRAPLADEKSFSYRTRTDTSHGSRGQLLSRDAKPLRKHVLIVDDELRVGEVICRALGDAGFTCATAASVDLALRHLQEQKVDLITLDLTMPGRSGIDLLRERKERFSGIPVVVLTGRSDFGAAIAAIDHGVTAYLIKPVDLDELVRLVEYGLQS